MSLKRKRSSAPLCGKTSAFSLLLNLFDTSAFNDSPCTGASCDNAF